MDEAPRGDPGEWGEDAPPIAAAAYDYRTRERIEPHNHTRGQLLYAEAGVMVVSTPDGTWVVPPDRAVWIPPAVGHELQARGAVRMRTLYLLPALCGDLPRGCCVVDVPPLLRELVRHVVSLAEAGDEPAPALREVILGRLRVMGVAPLRLPRPHDPQLQRLVALLDRDPADSRTLEGLGRAVGASARTLSRRFRRDTGLSYREWRQQHRLLNAIVMLGQGRSVAAVARGVGYESTSAFIAMFKRSTGQTPYRHRRRGIRMSTRPERDPRSP